MPTKPSGDAALPPYARKNRDRWERDADAYEQRHADDLGGTKTMAWGAWRIPEADLLLLGDVGGKDVLELGCGAARWSIALAGQGARPVGLDVSAAQLRHARHLMATAGVDFPLLHGSAERVPLPDRSFDIIFSDWGALTFCDPFLTIPEVARLLRPGGVLVFATASPLSFACLDLQRDELRQVLCNDYFGMHHFEWSNEVDFVLPHGEWIRLFGAHGLVLNRLIETQAPAFGPSTYRSAAEIAWSRRWPMEDIWRVRKT